MPECIGAPGFLFLHEQPSKNKTSYYQLKEYKINTRNTKNSQTHYYQDYANSLTNKILQIYFMNAERTTQNQNIKKAATRSC